MRVLQQQWITPCDGNQLSISKDREQYLATVKELAEADKGTPMNTEPLEVEIPDESIYADMIQSETVFLHPDELDIITYLD